MTAGTRGLRASAPFLALVGGVAATLFFWQAVVADRRGFVERVTRHEAELLAARLAAEARGQAQGLYRMSQRWEARKTMPREEWESDTRLYIAHHAGYQAIAWVDPSAVVRWVVPLAGNEALLQASLADETRKGEALETARQNGDKTLSRPVKVVKESMGFLACSPVFLPGGFGGWVVGFIRFDTFLNGIWYDESAQGYSVSLFYGGEEVYRRHVQQVPRGVAPQSVDVDLAGENLTGVSLRLRVWPSPALLASRSSLPAVTLIVGLLVSGLLSLSVGLAQKAQRRATEAEAVRRALETEAREREKAQRASEERYRLLFERNLYGVIRSTFEGHIVDCNEAAARLLGFGSRAELVGRNTVDLHVDPGNREKILSALREKGSVSNLEVPLRKIDGSVLWVLASVSLSGGEPGEQPLLDGVIFDISDRKRTEEALRESRAFLEQAQEVGHIGSWVSGLGEDDLLVWSPETCRIFGVPEEQSDRRVSTFFSMVHPEDREAVRRRAQAAIAEGIAYAVEHRILRPDGSIRWVYEQANVLQDAQGRPAQMVGTVQDITDRKLLQEQLIQAQKMEAVGRLAGGIAHDFNNLLTAILGYSDTLLSQLTGAPAWRADVEEIRKAGERAAGLTRQLLAFSRKQALAPEVLDLNVVVANVDKMLRRVIGEDIELVTVMEPALHLVRADPGQIEQVIMNLAVNSRDAMPRGGRLTIETQDADLGQAYAREHGPVVPGSYVMLAVTDTGCGMDEQTCSRVFEPFFTTKEQGKGTGLGLATVYGIVKQSGGYVWVYSEPELGTSFKIYLPQCDQAGQNLAPSAATTAASRGATETVFLVEDEPSVRKLASRILQGSGYRVLDFPNAEAALEALNGHSEQIDLLLTDVVMPGLSGPELATRVTALRPGMRVVYMSGYTDRSLSGRDRLSVGSTLIQKPFTPQILLRKVREVLDA